MSNREVVYKDLGLIAYQDAWTLQEKYHAFLSEQTDQLRSPAGYLFFLEHPHVYTLGLHGNQNNLLIDPDFLASISATYYHVNRGGDITYHGPGQIVGYPVIDIRRFASGVKDYVFRLEESVIRTLKHYDIESSRMEKATGVWLDAGKPGARKICAVGIRVSRGISMHGFAFNVNTRLDYYRWINPCGFTDKGVTSIEKELGREIDIRETKIILREEMAKVFGMKICQDEEI